MPRIIIGERRAAVCLLIAFLFLPVITAQEPEPIKDPPIQKKQTLDEAWIKEVQKLSPDKQVVAVIGKLKELNPGFDGKVIPRFEGAVTELNFVTDAITDISPVAALKKLKVLNCNGSGPGKGKLADLTPIKGLPLTALNVGWTQVSDLSPLKGMALTWLSFGGTQVTDASVIKGMPIVHLHCQGVDPSLEILRTLKGIQTINGLVAANYFGQQAGLQPDPKKVLSVAGRLTAKDPFDRMRPGCHHQVHKFKMKAGVAYIIDQIGPMDAYLRLEDAKGVQLAEDDDSGGNRNAAIVFTPKKTDTYRLIVTTCEQGQTGKYLLEAQPLKGAIRPDRTLAAAQTGWFNMGNQLKKESPNDPDPKRKNFRHAVWTYSMAAGTKYVISLESGQFLPYVRLEDASGKRIDEDFTPDGFQQTLINYQPKDSGLYRIVVSSANAEATGYYNLSVRPLNPGESTPVKGLRNVYLNGQLTKESKMDPLRPGRPHNVHTFKATAGRRYAISMNPYLFGLAPYMRLEAPDGTKLAEDDDREDVQRPLIVLQAKETGHYRIVASSFEAGKTGGYSFEIRPLQPGEPEPKKRYLAIGGSWFQFNNKDPVDKVREDCYHRLHPFRMKAEVKYVIDATGQNMNNQFLDVCLRLEDGKGKILAQDDLSTGNDDPRIVFVPKKTDTYNIVVVTEKPGAVGSYILNARAVGREETLPPRPTMSGYTYVPPPGPGKHTFFVGTAPKEAAIEITPAIWATSSFGSGGFNDDAHGYVEYRFHIENRSETEAHRVQLTIPRFRGAGRGWGHYLQGIKRSVDVEPKAKVTLSLFQPDLAIPQTDVEVEIDGVVQREGVSLNGAQRNRGQRFSSMHGGGGGRNEHLYILAPSDLVGVLGQNAFKTAVGRPLSPRRSSGTSGSMFNGVHYTYKNIHQFYGLPLHSWSTSWLGYSSYDGVVLSAQHLRAAAPEVKNVLWQYVECGGSLLLIGEGKLPDSWERNKIKGKEDWVEYYPGFGQCLVFPKARIRGLTPEHWHAIADMWDHGDRPWSKIRTASEAQRDFPVVENLGIPVRSLFIVMLVFAVLIGPVNIRLLTKKKRRIWLLWTVPGFSLLTCLLIVGYMVLSEGWHGKVRVGGLVFLDETTQRASGLSWLGLYTPMNPGDGLHFSQETEITPHVRQDRWSNQRHARTIDWSNDQHLDSGWIAPRLPAHFMVRNGEKRLERVLVRPGKDGSLTMTNGLKAPLQSIWLADMKGRIYSASGVPEGGEVTLKRTDLVCKKHPGGLRKLFTEDWYKLGKICAERPEEFLRPGCYLAILDGAPFLEKGLSNAGLRPEPTAVFGVLKEPL